MTWNTIDSGGQMFSTGSGYELGGTIGQADTGTLTGTGGYELQGGFWAAAAASGCGECRLYGDVVPAECLVDVDDLLCVLDDFVSPANCAGDGDIFPCDPDGMAPFNHGDGINDVDDISAVLSAFVGFNFCPDPCPP